jgi:hypothetical protein
VQVRVFIPDGTGDVAAPRITDQGDTTRESIATGSLLSDRHQISEPRNCATDNCRIGIANQKVLGDHYAHRLPVKYFTE